MRRPFYGVLLAPTMVLATYSGQDASPYDLMRPLLASGLAAALTFIIVGLATHRWHAAALFTSVAVLALLKPEFCLLALGWTLLAWRAFRRGEPWGVTPQVTYPLNVFVGAWFGVALVAAVTLSLPPPAAANRSFDVKPGSPNVYLVLLDGYPRRDSLLEYFAFDNTPFLNALHERGFQVAENSTSHYPSTMQTITTMMQGQPLEALLGEAWTGSHEQYRRLWHLLNSAPVPDAYEAAGYSTYSIVSPAPGHDWRTADTVLVSPWLSDFEAHLLDGGVLRFVLPFRAMQRASILDALHYLEASAGTSPRFVFAHILSPHTPYVFRADGGPSEPCGVECINHAGPPNPILADRLIGQLRFLNSQVIQAVDRVIAVDPEATIVVFSDHGLRRDRADMDEWFRTLFAARGRQFPDDVTTSDILPLLSDASRAPGAGD